ncbi:MAG: hypothetical protein RLZZ400_789 [Actinomycetota bacterium]|jgi:CobQ-like glutamine amidotransferase family enzyme
MAELRILHLYPETLRLNGERGNVAALKLRAELAGLSVKISTLEIGESLPSKRPHLIFIGSGTLSATKVAHADLAKKDRQIHAWIAQGLKVLAVGSGFDLVSKSLELPDGSFLEGLGLTNTTHKIEASYVVGEVWLSEGFAGFVNSNRLIVRGAPGLELGAVRSSDNAGLVAYVDGYQDGKVMASNVQGPLLPMNPQLADRLLSWVFPDYEKPKAADKYDRLAKKARAAILARVRS